MIKSKTMLVASVAAVTTGAAFADLSIVRTAKKTINLGASWVATNAPRRLTNEFPPANPL